MRGSPARRGKILPTVVMAALLATATYAFTASNTVPGSNAGQGNQTISGYTAGAVTYTLDTTTGTANVTGTSFTLTPDAGGAVPTAVKARLTGAGTYQNCTNPSGNTWTCSFSGVTALSAATLDIAAAH